MHKLKNKKLEKGITLIALVITIIVLLILAGVSIAMLTGPNGLLTQANDSANKSKEAEEREKIGLSYSAAMVDNDGKGVTQSNFETELKKYDNRITVTEDEENNNFKVLFPNGNEYTVESNGSIKGQTNTQGNILTPPAEPKLAKEVLQIKPDANIDYEKSPYVTYNGILCRVFYNDDYNDGSHGLQIISADNIKTKDSKGNDIEEKIKLGYEDDRVTASNFDYEGSANVDDNFKKAAASYNRVVDTLNKKAESYKDDSGIAIDARSLGSIATLKDGKFQDDTSPMYPSEDEKDEVPSYITDKGWYGKLKTGDTNYEEDAKNITTGQLQKLGLNASSETWLASRCLKFFSYSMGFDVLCVYPSGGVNSGSLVRRRF